MVSKKPRFQWTDRFVVCDEHLEDVGTADRVDGGHDDVRVANVWTDRVLRLVGHPALPLNLQIQDTGFKHNS